MPPIYYAPMNIYDLPQMVEGGGDGGGLFFDLIERKKALSA